MAPPGQVPADEEQRGAQGHHQDHPLERVERTHQRSGYGMTALTCVPMTDAAGGGPGLPGPGSPEPTLDQVNIVVSDMERSVAFYRLLGLRDEPAPPDWGPHHRRMTAGVAGGAEVELDSQAFAPRWNAGAPGARRGGGGRPRLRSPEPGGGRRHVRAVGRCRLQEPAASLRRLLGRPLRRRGGPRRRFRGPHEPGGAGHALSRRAAGGGPGTSPVGVGRRPGTWRPVGSLQG